jgi:hypothetical protein
VIINVIGGFDAAPCTVIEFAAVSTAVTVPWYGVLTAFVEDVTVAGAVSVVGVAGAGVLFVVWAVTAVLDKARPVRAARAVIMICFIRVLYCADFAVNDNPQDSNYL